MTKDKINCPECGSNRIAFQVFVLCQFDFNRHWKNITKGAFRESATEILAANWENVTSLYCRDCNCFFKEPL